VIHIDLFSGVGMFAYAMKQSGIRTVAFAEPDKFCQKVLAKHHPGVKIYDDVKDISYERLKEDGIVSDTQHDGWNETEVCGSVSDGEAERRMQQPEGLYSPSRPISKNPIQPTGIILTGGFPCQDLSVAGKQAGIDGERSGLWSEFARIIGDLRPDYTIIENVSALLTGDGGRWFDRILRDLAEIGMSCEWHCLCAGKSDGTLSAGAPHRRERVWIVAYPTHSERWPRQLIEEPTSERSQGNNESGWGCVGSDVAHPKSRKDNGRERRDMDEAEECGRRINSTTDACREDGQLGIRTIEPRLGLLAPRIASRLSGSRWLPEPRIGRVATGVPDRVNKLKALGNGLVWQIPAAIIESILNTTGD